MLQMHFLFITFSSENKLKIMFDILETQQSLQLMNLKRITEQTIRPTFQYLEKILALTFTSD